MIFFLSVSMYLCKRNFPYIKFSGFSYQILNFFCNTSISFRYRYVFTNTIAAFFTTWQQVVLVFRGKFRMWLLIFACGGDVWKVLSAICFSAFFFGTGYLTISLLSSDIFFHNRVLVLGMGVLTVDSPSTK